MPRALCIALTAASVRCPNEPSALPQSPHEKRRQNAWRAATWPPELLSRRVGVGAFCSTGTPPPPPPLVAAACACAGDPVAATRRRCHGSLWVSHDHPLAAAFLSAHCRNAPSTTLALSP